MATSSISEWLPRTRAIADRPGRRDATRRRRGFATPELQPLEPRDLLTVVVLPKQVFVSPRILPPTGQFLPVTVFGRLISTRPQTPAGFVHVTDQYRRIEPFGPMPLTPAGRSGANYQFDFRVTVSLQAQRSTNTGDGRHYSILVGASDADGNGGATVGVLVPNNYPARIMGATAVSGPRARKLR